VKPGKQILLFSFFLISFFTASAQDSLSVVIDTPVAIIDTIVPLDPALLPPEDSIQTIKKELRADKAKKAFQFFSYLKYSDKAPASQFTGDEKYKPYKGKKIRNIQIQIFKPYGAIEEDCYQSLDEDSCSLPLKRGQKFGNKIHFSSKEWYVKGDILFKGGDEVNPSLFADTEKLLWERKKFKDVQIFLFDNKDGSVDVLVYLQDKLSWVVGLGYNRRLIFGISTYNFFGLPNTFSVYTGINFNKYNLWAVGGDYKYENILKTQINFVTNFDIEKLNSEAFVSMYRNFFSIKTQWAFNVKYEYDYSTFSRTQDLRDTTSYIMTRSNFYSMWAAYALPVVKLFNIQDDKLKLLFATKLTYTKYKFRPFISYPNYDKVFVTQANYRFGIGVARWDYYLARNAFYLEVGEYFPRGYSVSYWSGPQFDEVYGNRTSFDLIFNYGIHSARIGYFYPQYEFSGYIRHKKGEEMINKLTLDYVSDRVNISKRAFFRQVFRASTSLGSSVTPDRYFNINEENGIRGFYSPRVKGSKSLTMNFESDFYLVKKIAKLKLMHYVFTDLGWVSENNDKIAGESVFQYGVGFGARIRSADLGIPNVDIQFSFYPNGKNYGEDLFGFHVYGTNPNAVQQNNMFVEPSFHKSYDPGHN
jgi:hypothetical protein